MSDAGSKQHGQCKLEGTAGTSFDIVNVIEYHWSKVHRVKHIASERQHRGMRGFFFGVLLIEGDELQSSDRFHGHQVRVSALPTTRQCGAMKVHHKSIRRRIVENVMVVRDHRLTIATKKIDLEASDTHRFKLIE